MITVTGNLTDDPHTFQTCDNTTGCELRVAVNLPSRTGTGDGPTRYLKVITSGVLAIHAAESGAQGRPGHHPGPRPDQRSLAWQRRRRTPVQGRDPGHRDRRLAALRPCHHRPRHPRRPARCRARRRP